MKAGDIVKLKSGGPKMTVTSVAEEKIRCMWWAGDSSTALAGNGYSESIFDAATLEAITP